MTQGFNALSFLSHQCICLFPFSSFLSTIMKTVESGRKSIHPFGNSPNFLFKFLLSSIFSTFLGRWRQRLKIQILTLSGVSGDLPTLHPILIWDFTLWPSLAQTEVETKGLVMKTGVFSIAQKILRVSRALLPSLTF